MAHTVNPVRHSHTNQFDCGLKANDGTRYAELANGSYGGCFSTGGIYAQLACSSVAGCFSDGTRYGIIADGSWAGNFNDSTRYACLASASIAGQFYDGTRCVQLANGSDAACGGDGSSTYFCLGSSSYAACFYKSTYSDCAILACDYYGGLFYSPCGCGICTSGCYYGVYACAYYCAGEFSNSYTYCCVQIATQSYGVYSSCCIDGGCFYCGGYGGGTDSFTTGDARTAYFCGGVFYYVS